MPFSEAHANHAINFIEQLKLTKGKWAGQPFKLLPWEKDSGFRRRPYISG